MFCNQVRQHLSALADGELHLVESKVVMLHLDGCPDCRLEFESLKAVRTNVRGLESITAPRLEMDMLIQNAIKHNKRRTWRLCGVGFAVSFVFATSLLFFQRRQAQLQSDLGRQLSLNREIDTEMSLTDIDGGPSFAHTATYSVKD
jgi:predicted anti-sigma-YlaC factor YlaD